jgi:hypothetical protein
LLDLKSSEVFNKAFAMNANSNDQRHIDGKKHQDFLKKYSKQPRIDGTTEQRLHHRSATLPNLSVENEFAVVILFFCLLH